MGTKTVHVDLTAEEKEILIQLFYDLYFNTGQDVEEFSGEFFFLVGAILGGSVPIQLEFLIEFEEPLIEAIPRLEKIFESREE